MSQSPPLLYKYLPVDAAINMLKRRQLWFGCPLKFPDDQDCRADLLENLDVSELKSAYIQELVQLLCGKTRPQPPYDPKGYLLHGLRCRETPWTPEEVEANFGDLYQGDFFKKQEHQDRIKKKRKEMLLDCRVLCLCENSKSKKMWDKYAGHGRGACIGFQYVKKLDSAWGAARPVQYVDKWPAIATPKEWARHDLFIEQIPFGKRAEAALYFKLRNYEYEQEWRMITKPRDGTQWDDGKKYHVAIDPTEVFEINLGWAITEDERDTLCSIWNSIYRHADISEQAQSGMS